MGGYKLFQSNLVYTFEFLVTDRHFSHSKAGIQELNKLDKNNYRKIDRQSPKSAQHRINSSSMSHVCRGFI